MMEGEMKGVNTGCISENRGFSELGRKRKTGV